MFKRITAVLAASALATVGFVAPSQAASEADCGKGIRLCIGLVTDTGKVDDKSFNQSAWKGAQDGAKAVGGFAKYIETIDPKDYANNIGQFASKNYDVIIGVGFLMAEAMTTAAKQYPKIKFIGVDQFQGAAVANLTGLVFPEDKAGFLAGYLAGHLTKSGKTGQFLEQMLFHQFVTSVRGIEMALLMQRKSLERNIQLPDSFTMHQTTHSTIQHGAVQLHSSYYLKALM